MKIIKIIAIILFISLLSFNTYLLLDKKLKKELDYKKKITKVLELNKSLENLLFNNVYLNLDSSLESDLKCIDEKGNKYFLSDLINDKPKLVLRLSDRMCDLCIISELNSLKNMNADIHKDDIILLASFSSFNALRIFKKKQNIPFSIYKIDALDESFLEKQNMPYYFVLEKDLKPKYQFIPDKNISRLSDKYLTELSSFFLNKYGLVKEIESGIEFANDIHDFGKLRNGKTYSTKFAFVNNMNEPLLIKDIKTTCGCTISKYDKSPILPKSKLDILIEYKAEHLGKFQKQIMVFSKYKKQNGKIDYYR